MKLIQQSGSRPGQIARKRPLDPFLRGSAHEGDKNIAGAWYNLGMNDKAEREPEPAAEVKSTLDHMRSTTHRFWTTAVLLVALSFMGGCAMPLQQTSDTSFFELGGRAIILPDDSIALVLPSGELAWVVEAKVDSQQNRDICETWHD
jgi:hypothetical protein